VARPGQTPGLPKDWKARCRKVKLRDKATCRRCGFPATGSDAHIDHVLARRIASARRLHAMSNLALLCGMCHAFKTHTVEPALYRGDVQSFERFLAVIGDPIPSSSTISRAYQRIRELQNGQG